MKKYILAYLLTISFSFFSQGYITYYNTANEAEFLLHTGKFSEANKILNDLKKSYKALKARESLYLGVSCYHLNDTISGFVNLEVAAKSFLELKEALDHYLKVDRNLISDFSRKKIYAINEKSIKEREEFLTKSFVDDTISFYTQVDHERRQAHAAKGEDIDLINKTRFLNFLLKQGAMPDQLVYGEAYAILFMDVPGDQLYKDYKFFAYQQLVKGNLCPRDYAILVDSKLYDESGGESSEYGVFPGRSNLDADILKENRKSIGLSNYCPTCCSVFPNYKLKFVSR